MQQARTTYTALEAEQFKELQTLNTELNKLNEIKRLFEGRLRVVRPFLASAGWLSPVDLKELYEKVLEVAKDVRFQGELITAEGSLIGAEISIDRFESQCLQKIIDLDKKIDAQIKGEGRKGKVEETYLTSP